MSKVKQGSDSIIVNADFIKWVAETEFAATASNDQERVGLKSLSELVFGEVGESFSETKEYAYFNGVLSTKCLLSSIDLGKGLIRGRESSSFVFLQSKHGSLSVSNLTFALESVDFLIINPVDSLVLISEIGEYIQSKDFRDKNSKELASLIQQLNYLSGVAQTLHASADYTTN